jgi:hypothetical protein
MSALGKRTEQNQVTKLERAIHVRDMVLSILQSAGTWKPINMPSGPTKHLAFEDGTLSVMLRTPFQPVHGMSNRYKHAAATLGIEARGNLPYGLDVWTNHKKVLNIGWNDGESVQLVSFHRGDWERHVAALALKSKVPAVS